MKKEECESGEWKEERGNKEKERKKKGGGDFSCHETPAFREDVMT